MAGSDGASPPVARLLAMDSGEKSDMGQCARASIQETTWFVPSMTSTCNNQASSTIG
jgi:hypothetical protein